MNATPVEWHVECSKSITNPKISNTQT
jgi:hypothetical protein